MINPKQLSNNGDELDYLYHLLKDDSSVEKIAFPLFSHELFVWSQADLFQPHERQRLLILARNEADLLVLPLAENIPMTELALEYLTRYVIFKVFNNREIRKELLDYYRAHYPSPLKDRDKLYNSLVYLIWQERIGIRYHDILIDRLRSNPVAKHTFILAMSALEKYCDITSTDSFLASQKSSEFLLKRYLLIDKKRDLVNFLLGELSARLREMPFEKLCHEVFYTDRVIETDFIDEWRGEHAQKRYPEGGIVSLDAEVTTPDGRKISNLELLEGKYNPLQTQPLEIHYPLTASQKKALREFLSNTEVKILETRYNYSDATPVEVAEHVGCTQSKVSKAQRKFKRFEKKIKEILEIQ